MKTLENKIQKNVGKSNWRFYSFLFSFMVLFVINTMAQSNDNTAKNLSTGITTSTTDVQKDRANQEFMSYVYMGIGIVVILGLALLGVAKKKRNGNDPSVNSHVVKHHHHHHHDKRYGTGHARA